MYCIEPILKWAGGKRQLLNEIATFITPDLLDGHTLFEPFVGGGAVFLSLEHDSVYINDFNKELINVYEVIRDRPDEFIVLLSEHQAKHSHDYYYKIRDLDLDPSYSSFSSSARAARIIYLNRTCFNGLYRVNAKGHYNVPIGRYANPEILCENKIRRLHSYLSSPNIHISCGDFGQATMDAKAGDVVYFDPPYDYDTDGFTNYTELSFSKDDLLRLRNCCNGLLEKGCHVLVSNNNTKYVNEIFSDSAYSIKVVNAKRLINCNAKQRKAVEEVLIWA